MYDAYLDAELPQLYDRASLARRGPAALLVRRFENVLAGLHTLVADTTEVVERVENGLKVTNDVYLARIYQAALALFREDAWRLGLARASCRSSATPTPCSTTKPRPPAATCWR